MKRMLAAALAAMMCLAILPLFAVTVAETSGDYEYQILSDDTAEIMGYTGSGGDIVIPDELDEYPVSSIGAYAFSGTSSLTGVTIPGSVNSIGNYAFSYCNNLYEATLLNGASSIGGNAFVGCVSLTYLTIPGGVADIGTAAFSGCSSLTDVTIPGSVTDIGNWAFYACSSLTAVYFEGEPPTLGGSGVFSATPYDLVLYIPAALVSSWAPSGVAVWEGYPIAAYGGCCSCIDCIGCGEVGCECTCCAPFASAVNWTLTAGTVNTKSGNIAAPYDIDIYKFTAPSSGNYFFYTTNSDGDPMGTLYDSSYTQIAHNDDWFGLDFRIVCSLTAGQVYYLAVSAYYDGTTAYTVHIRDFCDMCDCDDCIGCGEYGCFCACCFEGLIDGDYEYEIWPDGTAEIVRYWGSGGDIVIPAALGGYPVSCIGSFAFGYNDMLTDVTIPSGVIWISDYAFAWCENLSSVSIPSSVTWIGCRAFYGTPWFDSLTKPFEIVGDGVLIKYNGSEAEVSIPNGVKCISDAFVGNDAIESVVIPDSVTSIAGYAFGNCYNLANVTIPNSVTWISVFAFGNCSSLVSVTLPGSLVSLFSDAFFGCGNLLEVCFEGEPPLSLWDAFSYTHPSLMLYYPSALVSSWAPNGETSRDGYPIAPYEPCALRYAALQSLYDGLAALLPSVTVADDDEGLQIGDTWITAADKATLQAVMNDAKTMLDNKDAADQAEINVMLVTLADAAERINTVPNVGWEGDFQYYITTDGTAEIIGYWGAGGKISIPGTMKGYPVTSIGYDAFSYDDDLTGVTIPGGVNHIGVNAFYSCGNLTDITIPSSVVDIGDWAFWHTPWFEALKDEFAIVGDGVLIKYNGTKVNVTIPSGVKFISDAFYVNTDIESVIIPRGVHTIGRYAFGGCSSLKSVTIPDSVTGIKLYAFGDCSLESVTIPGSVTEIEDFAFADCTGLTRVYFEGVPPEMGWEAFAGTHPELILYYPSRFASAWAPKGETEWEGYAIEPYEMTSKTRGDANCDWVVNAADAAAILRHLVRLTILSPQGQINAKVTGGDGGLSAADAAKILRFLVRLEKALV